MDQDPEVQCETKPDEIKLTETGPFDPAKLPSQREDERHSFKWIVIIVTIFLIGLAVFQYVNHRLHQPVHLFPIQALPEPNLVTLRTFDFKEPLQNSWKEHVFKSHTTYQVENGDLHALSKTSSSMLYQEAHADLRERPFLTWEWKAVQFPVHQSRSKLSDRAYNDFVGRVYILFKGRSPFAAEVIQYVWDDQHPEGASAESPFLKNVKILVVRNGKAENWVMEKRDLLQDYQMLFGRRPKWPLVAIGVMSDSDNTESQSEVYFRNLSLKKPKT